MQLLALVLLSSLSTAAKIHEIHPDQHSRLVTTDAIPVPRIQPRDSVITRTWESCGRDHENVWHIEHPYVYPESGNPLMGPFYIEGAALRKRERR